MIIGNNQTDTSRRAEVLCQAIYFSAEWSLEATYGSNPLVNYLHWQTLIIPTWSSIGQADKDHCWDSTPIHYWRRQIISRIQAPIIRPYIDRYPTRVLLTECFSVLPSRIYCDIMRLVWNALFAHTFCGVFKPRRFQTNPHQTEVDLAPSQISNASR